MEFVILFDVSGSMDSNVYDEQYGSERKINLVKNHIASLLKDTLSNDISLISLFTFSSTLEHLESFPKQKNVSHKNYLKEVAEYIISGNYHCVGGTNLWDSLRSLIDIVKENGD